MLKLFEPIGVEVLLLEYLELDEVILQLLALGIGKGLLIFVLDHLLVAAFNQQLNGLLL